MARKEKTIEEINEQIKKLQKAKRDKETKLVRPAVDLLQNTVSKLGDEKAKEITEEVIKFIQEKLNK